MALRDEAAWVSWEVTWQAVSPAVARSEELDVGVASVESGPRARGKETPPAQGRRGQSPGLPS